MKPFVKRGKSDFNDAEAINEALTRKTMRFVPVKSAEQQASGMIFRARTLAIRQRTQAINALGPIWLNWGSRPPKVQLV